MALNEQSSETAEQSMDSVDGSVSSEESSGQSLVGQWLNLTMDQVCTLSLTDALSTQSATDRTPKIFICVVHAEVQSVNFAVTRFPMNHS